MSHVDDILPPSIRAALASTARSLGAACAYHALEQAALAIEAMARPPHPAWHKRAVARSRVRYRRWPRGIFRPGPDAQAAALHTLAAVKYQEAVRYARGGR